MREQRTVVKRNSYAPFGETFAPTVIDGTGYTGHVMDQATGLTYMQQRYYDPAIGRFLSNDPVVADSNTGGNFNRYWYANSNPYRFTDSDGRAPGDSNGERFGSAVANSFGKKPVAASTSGPYRLQGPSNKPGIAAGPLKSGYVSATNSPAQARTSVSSPAIQSGTMQIGLTVAGTVGSFGGSVTAGLAVDGNGGSAAYTETSVGAGPKADLAAGVSFAFSNATTVSQLTGASFTSSAGAGAGLHYAGTASVGPAPNGETIVSGGGTVAIGAGGGASAGRSETSIYPITESRSQ